MSNIPSPAGEWVPYEIKFQRNQTLAWIRFEGIPIALIRPAAKVASGAGGFVSQGQTQVLPAKQRIVGTQGREQFLQNQDVGTGAKLKQYLLGTWDDDIRQGDQFVNPRDGKTYTVEYVHSDRTIETRAELAEIS